MQIYGVDYFTINSPIVKLTTSSFCTTLAIATRQKLEIESFDFNVAYLNGELDANKEIYMQAPLGYDNDPHTVKRLRNLPYGLKQASRHWYDTLVRALKSLGFDTSHQCCRSRGVRCPCGQ